MSHWINASDIRHVLAVAEEKARDGKSDGQRQRQTDTENEAGERQQSERREGRKRQRDRAKNI